MSLNIAARALTTNLSALQVIGNNIANASTPGYSRQSVTLEQVQGQFSGSAYFGKGVQLTGVNRSFDQFLTQNANTLGALSGSDSIRFKGLQQVETLFPLGEGSLGASVTKLMNVWVDAAAAPTDGAARNVVLNTMDELARRFNDTQSQLEELRINATTEVSETVTRVNDLAARIANLNDQISRVQSDNRVPNDLLDQRDLAIAELNKLVQVNTLNADDNTITVFAAGSYPLVLGNRAGSLVAGQDPADTDRVQVRIRIAGSAPTSTPLSITPDFQGLDTALRGGELQGLVRFVNKDLTDVVNTVGRLALSMATQYNTQHRGGVDLLGQPGGNLFNGLALPNGQPGPANVGTGAVALTVTDPTAFVASDYELVLASATAGPPDTYTGTLRRLSDGAYANGSGGWVNAPPAVPISLTAPLAADGLQIDLSNGAVAGDRFILRPFSDAAEGIARAVTSPNNLALASPVIVQPVGSNSGQVTVEGVSLTVSAGTLTPGTIPPVSFSFNASGQITLGAVTPPATASIAPSPLPFESGRPFAVTVNDGAGNTYELSVSLRGVPRVGDTFTLSSPLAPPPGSPELLRQNADNAKAFLALRDRASFDGGTSLSDGYIPVISRVASLLQEGKFNAEFSQSQAASAEAQRANFSGVNLDEEAARLLQFQQAYQASARYLQTTQSLFDTLLASFGR